ncbi:MAG: hypothetical protein ACE5H9_05240 [Anaerolineae bacterium]
MADALIHHDADPPFSVDELMRRYGPRRARMKPAFRQVLEQMVAEARTLAEPRFAGKTFPAADLPLFSRHLPGAEMITLGVCTLGPALEARASAFFPDDPLKGVILDQVGTAWVDGLLRRFHGRLRARARARLDGWRAGPAYRPGLGRWPLALQPEILGRLPADEMGITLTGAGMMIPQKSISFIVPQGRRLKPGRFGGDDRT